MTQRNADPEEGSSADLESGHLALPRSASPSFHLQSSAQSRQIFPRLVNVTMIVRNKESKIAACLPLVAGLLD